MKRIEQLAKIIKNRKSGDTTDDSQLRAESWGDTLDYIQQAKMDTFRELVTLKGADGKDLSRGKWWTSVGARVIFAVATLGESEVAVWTGEALYIAHDEVAKGNNNDVDIQSKIMINTLTNVLFDYVGGKAVDGLGRILSNTAPGATKVSKEFLSNITNRVGDLNAVVQQTKVKIAQSLGKLSEEEAKLALMNLSKEETKRYLNEIAEASLRSSNEQLTKQEIAEIGRINQIINSIKEEVETTLKSSVDELNIQSITGKTTTPLPSSNIPVPNELFKSSQGSSQNNNTPGIVKPQKGKK